MIFLFSLYSFSFFKAMKKFLTLFSLGLLLTACQSNSNPNSNPYMSEDSKQSELIIEELELGTGAESKKGDTLRVHYTGTLEDGTKFDSSVDRGEPFEFVIGQGYVIEGWEKGMLGMKEGGKRKLTIPSDMAYGDRGVGSIPGGATLLFEVELLEIK
jgi:FKBP-type peptidyl-prolyl cis-trans isomerase